MESQCISLIYGNDDHTLDLVSYSVVSKLIEGYRTWIYAV